MGGYVNSGIIFQLPISGRFIPAPRQVVFGDSDEKIIRSSVHLELKLSNTAMRRKTVKVIYPDKNEVTL